MRGYLFDLEFPRGCSSFTIGPYRFTRLPEYPQRLQQLQHRVSVLSEFDIKATTGGHAATGEFEGPDNEPAELPWSGGARKGLDDAIALLRLFTGRDVFAYPQPTIAPNAVVVVDVRSYRWGQGLRVSIPFLDRTGENGEPEDIGFQLELDRIYRLLRDRGWAQEWNRGSFILLALNAFKQWPLESAFVLSWKVWEELFLLRSGLSRAKAKGKSSRCRMTLVLEQSGLRAELTEHSDKVVAELAETRNAFIHEGIVEDERLKKCAEVFVRLTESLTAVALGLKPSNVFNALDYLSGRLPLWRSGD